MSLLEKKITRTKNFCTEENTIFMVHLAKELIYAKIRYRYAKLHF